MLKASGAPLILPFLLRSPPSLLLSNIFISNTLNRRRVCMYYVIKYKRASLFFFSISNIASKKKRGKQRNAMRCLARALSARALR